MAESVGDLTSALTTLVQNNLAYVGVIVFVLGFAESIALVSLFVPSTALFLVIGGLHGAAGGAFFPVWIAAAAGAVAGDIVSYLLGRWFKDDIHRIWPFSRMPDLIPKGHALIERWGLWAVFASKFTGGLRPFMPVVAGGLDMPWLVFLIASVVSSLAWAGVFLSPGYGFALLKW